jgi:hypothetical protein
VAQAFRPSILKSLFDGTWRPIYEPPGPQAAPDVMSLADGIYECRSCDPPYRVPADGREHAVEAHPRFDTLAVTVLDDWTMRQAGHRRGAIVLESTTVVAADGDSTTETRTASMQVGEDVVPIMAPLTGGNARHARPVLFRVARTRVGSAIAGAHLLTGTWQTVELDLVNHDEDTTYRVEGDRLTMSDRLGRSFSAKLDGTVAPYVGDPRFTRVSVRSIDERTIEESDLAGETVVQVTRWRVDPDGTMHVRFDDGRGHVMEQKGYKLP